MGPPGAGKGTFSSLCVQKLGHVQISTGNLCRRHIVEQTNIGLAIDFAIKSGKLIPDNLIVEMVEDWLREQVTQDNSIILDGFPRTVPQAIALGNLLESFSSLKLNIVKFAITDEVIVNRLAMRYVCQNKDCQIVYSLMPGSSFVSKKFMECDSCQSVLVRRQDDHPETVRERLSVYRQFEDDLVEYYRKNGYIINEFNAEKSFDEVFKDFKQLFGMNKQ